MKKHRTAFCIIEDKVFIKEMICVRLKGKIILLSAVILGILLILIIVLYSRPFVLANNLIFAANNSDTYEFHQNNIISDEQYHKLRIINDSDNEIYLNGGVSSIAIRKLAFNEITLEYKIHYVVHNANTDDVVERVEENKTIDFVFENWHWAVDTVS